VTVVTFLTDFGLQDDFVGTCHAVIAGIAPDVRVIDVTHGIAPQAVLQGALVLRSTRPYLATGGRWPCAPSTAGSSSAPTTAC
jgi:S-adenosylmethionine hydrolase